MNFDEANPKQFMMHQQYQKYYFLDPNSLDLHEDVCEEDIEKYIIKIDLTIEQYNNTYINANVHSGHQSTEF